MTHSYQHTGFKRNETVMISAPTNMGKTQYDDDGHIKDAPRDEAPFTKWLLIDDIRHYPTDAVARDGRTGLRMLSEHRYVGLLIDYQLELEMEVTGLDVIEMAHHKGILPKYVHVVSTHPTGRQKIDAFLEEHGYDFVDNTLSMGYLQLPGYWALSRQENKAEQSRKKRKVTVRVK